MFLLMASASDANYFNAMLFLKTKSVQPHVISQSPTGNSKSKEGFAAFLIGTKFLKTLLLKKHSKNNKSLKTTTTAIAISNCCGRWVCRLGLHARCIRDANSKNECKIQLS